MSVFGRFRTPLDITLRIDAAGTFTLDISKGGGTVRLLSPSATPGGGDRRPLGAPISAFTLDGETFPWTTPASTRESIPRMFLRWTDGEGVLVIPPAPTARTLAVAVSSVMTARIAAA